MTSFFYQQYFFIFLFFFVSILLSFIIFSLSYILTIHKPDTEKLFPYEWGFDPYEDARQAFDVRFYLIFILIIKTRKMRFELTTLRVTDEYSNQLSYFLYYIISKKIVKLNNKLLNK